MPSELDVVVSEVPKWITMFIAVFAVVSTMAVGYGTIQTRIDAVATRQSEHSMGINTLEKKIVLVEKELLRDKITIEFIQKSILDLTKHVDEALVLNREIVLFIKRIEREKQK